MARFHFGPFFAVSLAKKRQLRLEELRVTSVLSTFSAITNASETSQRAHHFDTGRLLNIQYSKPLLEVVRPDRV